MEELTFEKTVIAMQKKKWKIVLCLFVLVWIINIFTELFSFGGLTVIDSRVSFFSVLCYNVKCSDKHYADNQKHIANLILKESPDLVFLCEFHRSVSKTLDSMVTHIGNYKGYYRSKSNCIFYSKFDIDSVASINTYTSAGKRAINNLVHVNTPKGILTVVGCHLSSSRKDFWQGCSNRTIEADSIFKRVKSETYPVIVMGDLNDFSGSHTVERIKKAGLKDAWWEGGLGYGSTFHNGWLRLRLDHILYDKSRLKLNKIKVLESDLSDHNALIANFSFI